MQFSILKYFNISQFSSVAQSCPAVATPCSVAHQASLSTTDFQSFLKLTSIELVMPSNHLILCHPLLLLPSIFPSIRVFSNDSVFFIRWPKHWSFSLSTSSCNEYSGLISLKTDWLDLLAVQGTLKSLPSPVASTSEWCFCFGSASSFLLELFLHSSPGEYWTPGDFIFLN